MLTCVDICSSVHDEAERRRCIERCVSIVKGGPAPPSPPSCMPADAVYELNDFIAAYRRTPRGFEDWQIASRIASVVASAIKRCEIDKVIEYISTALDASGIDRYAVYNTYIHGLSPKVVEALYHIFPNMTPRIGANAPITIQLPAAETPTVAADTAHLPTPPAATTEVKEKHQQETTPKSVPAAGPGEVALRAGRFVGYEAQVGTVKLPLSVMERLGLKPGDFVEIIGTTSTYAVVQPTEEEDIVKMDEVTRSNAGAELGDYVRIKKATVPPAEKIVLKTNQPVDAEYVKRYLLFKPLAKGNITAVPQQDKTVTLRVEDVVPAPAAYVQLSTKIEIQRDTYSEHRQPEVGTSPAPYALLKVAKAKPRDVGRGIVRIPVRIMKKLGIEPGDYVEIVGKKYALLKVAKAKPRDVGRGIVRIPVRIMKKLGIEPGDYVEIVGKKYALLKVAKAKPRDVGRGIVRIPVRIMKKLGIEPGDYVEIVGKNIAYAQVWPAYPEDEDKDIVQMDSIIMQSAGVGVGDTVKIEKAALKPAQKVVFTSTEPVNPEYLKRWILFGKPISKGQTIDVPFYGGSIRLVVAEVQPEPAAYVTIDTDVIVETTKIEVRHDNSVNSKQQGRELSAGKELLLGTADLLRAFGFLLLFVAFIFVVTNYGAVEFNALMFILSIGYIISALISPIALTFADRRAWVSALVGASGIIPLLIYMPEISVIGSVGALFIFVILWLIISVIIPMQAYLEEWGSGGFYAALAGVIGVGYMVLAIAKTIDAIRRYARAV